MKQQHDLRTPVDNRSREAVQTSALMRDLDRILRVMERRARLLGLDVPERIDITARIRERAIEEGLDPDLALAAAERILSGR